jgi:hypothetical protein
MELNRRTAELSRLGPELKLRIDESDWQLADVRDILDEEIHERRMDKLVALMERPSNMEAQIEMLSQKVDELSSLVKKAVLKRREAKPSSALERSAPKLPAPGGPVPEVPVPEETEPGRRQEAEAEPGSPPPAPLWPSPDEAPLIIYRRPSLRTRLKRKVRNFLERQTWDLRMWLSFVKRDWSYRKMVKILIFFGIGLWVMFWTISQIKDLYGK